MKKYSILIVLMLVLDSLGSAKAQSQTPENFIGPNTTVLKSDLMTPEALWAMGRVGGVKVSPDGRKIVYNVTYYSVAQNKSRSAIYVMDLVNCKPILLTSPADSESGAVFVNAGKSILYLKNGQLWTKGIDGNNAQQVATTKAQQDIDEFLISPDQKKIVLIRQVPTTSSIQKNPDDLPLSSGMVINDMMYKHWDHFVQTIPHPFVADFALSAVGEELDLLQDEPYECPMMPFGGIEELAWSPDGKSLAYSCLKKVGKAYSMSTDSDIFVYSFESGKTTNVCKPADYVQPSIDDTRSLQEQEVNSNLDLNMGYDLAPQFSPDGRYLAWTSMARDGYESDRARMCVMDIASGKKTYITESLESGVDTYCWSGDSKQIYFSATWHGTNQIYSANMRGELKKLTSGDFDNTVQGLDGTGRILIKRHSISQADEIYLVETKEKAGRNVTQLTHENDYFYEHLSMGEVKERWVETIDGKKMMCWVVYPPHFDKAKKYPTLLFCQGGPQSAVSQGWSYRWNPQLMAAQGYIVILPSRRGVPGFGMEWLEEISGDYTGLCMQDYLSAIDGIKKEPYVDADKLGCVGASFGGYSVYWLAGHHEGRFKAFISHDGIYNTQQQYTETDELWFPNWDMKAAPWRTDVAAARKVYEDSPHLSVDKWDTPILCIHGMKDYRIIFTQAESAFQAAKMRGLPAQLLLLPDENHWVLKPQNGILWQRTFFGWLDRWLK